MSRVFIGSLDSPRNQLRIVDALRKANISSAKVALAFSDCNDLEKYKILDGKHYEQSEEEQSSKESTAIQASISSSSCSDE